MTFHLSQGKVGVGPRADAQPFMEVGGSAVGLCAPPPAGFPALPSLGPVGQTLPPPSLCLQPHTAGPRGLVPQGLHLFAGYF